MDLNHDKQIQSLLCYRYTIGQTARRENNVFARRVKPPSMRITPRAAYLWGQTERLSYC